MRVGEEDDKDGCEKRVYQSTSTMAIINHQPCYFLSGDYLGRGEVRWKRWKLIVQHRGRGTGFARWCCPERAEVYRTLAVYWLKKNTTSKVSTNMKDEPRVIYNLTNTIASLGLKLTTKSKWRLSWAWFHSHLTLSKILQFFKNVGYTMFILISVSLLIF